jgi:sodium pump decarboxylase gamma subunit
MILEGFQLMVIGMGVVFGFLLILVLAMTFAARFFEHFGHLFPFEDLDEGHLKHNVAAQHTDIALVVAIAHAFAKNREQETSNG